MYLMEELVDIALEKIDKNARWRSEDHRNISIAICIANPNVFSMDSLLTNIRIINKIPIHRIRKITIEGLQTLGCKF